MTVLEGTWEEIAAHAPELRGRRLRVEVLPNEQDSVSLEPSDLTRIWTGRELMELPRERRSRILEFHASQSSKYYRTDPEVREWLELGVEDGIEDNARSG